MYFIYFLERGNVGRKRGRETSYERETPLGCLEHLPEPGSTRNLVMQCDRKSDQRPLACGTTLHAVSHARHVVFFLQSVDIVNDTDI